MIFFPLLLKLHINKPAAAALHAASPAATRARFVMGTVLEMTAYGDGADAALTRAFEEVERQDRYMSDYKEESELSRMNREAFRADFKCSADLWGLLRRMEEAYRLSGGAFDPTVLRGRPAPGFDKVLLDAGLRTARFLDSRVRIDPGGIGKGYALDAAAKVLRDNGVHSALLNFGGQILAVGAPPGENAWTVETADSPRRLRVRDASVSTSSQEERPGHILEPKTGLAVRRDGKVAVAAPDGTSADYWSTALFVLGPAAAPAGFQFCAFETPGEAIAGDCSPYMQTPRRTPGTKKQPAKRRHADDLSHRSKTHGGRLDFRHGLSGPGSEPTR